MIQKAKTYINIQNFRTYNFRTFNFRTKIFGHLIFGQKFSDNIFKNFGQWSVNRNLNMCKKASSYCNGKSNNISGNQMDKNSGILLTKIPSYKACVCPKKQFPNSVYIVTGYDPLYEWGSH